MLGMRSEDTQGGVDLSSDKGKLIYRQPQPCTAKWFFHSKIIYKLHMASKHN